MVSIPSTALRSKMVGVSVPSLKCNDRQDQGLKNPDATGFSTGGFFPARATAQRFPARSDPSGQ